MEQFASFVHLGGYGAYVWPAYGAAALVLLGLLIRTLASLRANERLLAALRTPPPSGAGMTVAPTGAARPETAR